MNNILVILMIIAYFSNNFYIVIPKIYDSNNIILTFFINYIYDLNTIISNISLSFINESSKPAHFKISNDNCYYDNTYNEIRTLLRKINSENNKLKVEIPSNEKFKFAFINTIQQFELPENFMISHNDLSDFSRYF